MKAFYKIMSCLLACSTVVFCLMWLARGCTDDNKIAKIEKELSDCRNAPHRIDTVHDSIMVYSNTIIHPKPKIITDTVYKKDGLCRNFYDSTYRSGRLKIHYQIQTNGCEVEALSFPDVVAPKEVIYDTKVIDTCIGVEPAYKPKNHFGVELNLTGNNFKVFPGVGCGLFWSFKDKWGINGGIEYMTPGSTLYGVVGLKIYLK